AGRVATERHEQRPRHRDSARRWPQEPLDPGGGGRRHRQARGACRMSILLDATARVLIVGITGKFGTFSLRDLAQSGTKVVGGVSYGRDGETIDNVPVFSSAAKAVAETGANAALIYVPAWGALDAVLEVIEAGCPLIAYPGDGLPVFDAMEMRAAALASG